MFHDIKPIPEVMKKIYLFLLAIPLLLAGCSKEEEDTPEAKEVYMLSAFEFYLDEGDGATILKEVHDFPAIKNYTDQTIIVDIPFLNKNELQETSCFYYDGEFIDYILAQEELDTPRLPENIRESGELFYSMNKGVFAPGETEYFPYQPMINTIFKKCTMGPNSMLQVADTVFYRQMIVSYKMRFETIPSQEIFDLTGKWEGKYVDHVSGCVIHSEIKD